MIEVCGINKPENIWKREADHLCGLVISEMLNWQSWNHLVNCGRLLSHIRFQQHLLEQEMELHKPAYEQKETGAAARAAANCVSGIL